MGECGRRGELDELGRRWNCVDRNGQFGGNAVRVKAFRIAIVTCGELTTFITNVIHDMLAPGLKMLGMVSVDDNSRNK